MRIAVIGQAAFGKDVLEALVKKEEDVAAVLCPPDRKDRPFDPIKEYAVEHDIPVYQYKRMSCLLYTSPSPRDGLLSRMPSSA